MKFLMFAFALLSLGGFIFGIYDNRSAYGFNFSGFIACWSFSSAPLIYFLLNKNLVRKKLMFIYSLLSLTGFLFALFVGSTSGDSGLGTFSLFWLVFSLPLIIQLIYIKIFNEEELKGELGK